MGISRVGSGGPHAFGPRGVRASYGSPRDTDKVTRVLTGPRSGESMGATASPERSPGNPTGEVL